MGSPSANLVDPCGGVAYIYIYIYIYIFIHTHTYHGNFSSKAAAQQGSPTSPNQAETWNAYSPKMQAPESDDHQDLLKDAGLSGLLQRLRPQDCMPIQSDYATSTTHKGL